MDRCKGILNENVELLSFQEAMERFAQQITLEYSFEDEEEEMILYKV